MRHKLNELATKYKISGKDLVDFEKSVDDMLERFKAKVLQSLKNMTTDSDDVPERVKTGAHVNQLFHVLGTDISNDIQERLRNAPEYSIMIDESEDNGHVPQLIIYAQWIENGKKVVRLIGLIPLVQDAKASTITKAILDLLKAIGVNIHKMVGFGSDGASVMLGENGGVAKLLRDVVGPHLINFHCMAHRVALSAKVGVQSHSVAAFVYELVRAIAGDFAMSGQRIQRLKEMQKAFKTKVLTVLRLHTVRWLSTSQSANRLNTIDKDLLEFYQVLFQTEGHPRFHQLADYRNLRWLRFLSDVLRPLTAFTQYAQSRSLSFDILQKRLDTTIKDLNALLAGPGTWEEKFMEEVEIGDGWSSITYHGFNLRLRRNWRKDLQNSKEAFIKATVTDLKRRFDNLGELTSAFRVLTKFGKMDAKQISGDLLTLATAYGLDIDELELQFINWQTIYNDEGFRSSVDALLHLDSIQDEYDLIFRLYC